MKKMVVVLDTNTKQQNALCNLLADNHYQTAPMKMLSELEQQLEQNEFQAAIINLDNIYLNPLSYITCFIASSFQA